MTSSNSSSEQVSLDYPVFVVVATVKDSPYEGCYVVGVRLDRQQAIRELRGAIYSAHPHGKFRPQALNGLDLMAHYRKSGKPELGRNIWWVSSDATVWITDGVEYAIVKSDASQPIEVMA